MISGSTRRTIAVGAIGNVLEWYDFAVYGYFAAAIGRTFFPSEDPVAQVLAAFGIFAVGFLMRPVGGALIGHIGDRFGRRAALTFSVAAMAIPTFLVGVLPGYQVLGIAAPILLTLLRMIQGLSVGGEYTTSIVFMVERAPPGRRGLIGAMAGCGAVGGILLGSATGALLASVMPAEGAGGLGLAHSVPARSSRRPGRVPSAASRPGRAAKVHNKRRSPLLETMRNHGPLLLRLAAALGLQLGRLLPDVRLHRELAADSSTAYAPAHALGINTISMVGAAAAHDPDGLADGSLRPQARNAVRAARWASSAPAVLLADAPASIPDSCSWVRWASS